MYGGFVIQFLENTFVWFSVEVDLCFVSALGFDFQWFIVSLNCNFSFVFIWLCFEGNIFFWQLFRRLYLLKKIIKKLEKNRCFYFSLLFILPNKMIFLHDFCINQLHLDTICYITYIYKYTYIMYLSLFFVYLSLSFGERKEAHQPRNFRLYNIYVYNMIGVLLCILCLCTCMYTFVILITSKRTAFIKYF